MNDIDMCCRYNTPFLYLDNLKTILLNTIDLFVKL